MVKRFIQFLIKFFITDLFGQASTIEKLKEEKFPRDAMGRPDLSYYTDPLTYYVEMHQQSLASLDGPKQSREDAELDYRRRVQAQWGLIAKGSASIAYALSLLKGKQPEAREDGASILAELGSNESVVNDLIAALESETDTVARDTIVGTLGQIKSRKAVPVLTTMIRDERENYDSRLNAVESLGRIVGKRFHEQKNPIQAASVWLEKNIAG